MMMENNTKMTIPGHNGGDSFQDHCSLVVWGNFGLILGVIFSLKTISCLFFKEPIRFSVFEELKNKKLGEC